MSVTLHSLAPLPLLASVEQTLSYALGGLSLSFAVIAIVLASLHSKAISKVQKTIQIAEEQTRKNLDETTKVGAQTLDALNLHEILVTDEHLSSSITSLATDFAQILQINDPLLRTRARQDINRARTYINLIAEGHLTIGPEALAADEEIPSALLEVTEDHDCFWASSVVSPAFWARASSYLQLQKDRIEEADLTINRVFIFNTEAEFKDKHAQQQLRLQVEKGINVHYVVKPKYAAQDLVAVARPRNSEQGSHEDVLYAAEFAVSDGRVTRIDLWSAQAGHKDRVTRVWNTLNRFYDDSKPYKPESASVD